MRQSMAGRGVDGKRPTVSSLRAWVDFSIRLCRVVALAPDHYVGRGQEYRNHRAGAWDQLYPRYGPPLPPIIRAASAPTEGGGARPLGLVPFAPSCYIGRQRAASRQPRP